MNREDRAKNFDFSEREEVLGQLSREELVEKLDVILLAAGAEPIPFSDAEEKAHRAAYKAELVEHAVRVALADLREFWLDVEEIREASESDAWLGS